MSALLFTICGRQLSVITCLITMEWDGIERHQLDLFLGMVLILHFLGLLLTCTNMNGMMKQQRVNQCTLYSTALEAGKDPKCLVVSGKQTAPAASMSQDMGLRKRFARLFKRLCRGCGMSLLNIQKSSP